MAKPGALRLDKSGSGVIELDQPRACFDFHGHTRSWIGNHRKRLIVGLDLLDVDLGRRFPHWNSSLVEGDYSCESRKPEPAVAGFPTCGLIFPAVGLHDDHAIRFTDDETRKDGGAAFRHIV